MFDSKALQAYCFTHADSIRRWVTIILTNDVVEMPTLQDLDAFIAAQMVATIVKGIAQTFGGDPIDIWQRIAVTIINEGIRP